MGIYLAKPLNPWRSRPTGGQDHEEPLVRTQRPNLVRIHRDWVNASVQLLPSLLLSGQILAGRAGEICAGTSAIDFASADITLVESALRRAALRAGRIKNLLGSDNETRDGPFTLPGICFPQVDYFDRARNLILSTDGATLYADTYKDSGSVSLNFSEGWPVIGEHVEWTNLNGDVPGGANFADRAPLAGR